MAGFVIAGFAQGEGYDLKQAAIGIAREACALAGPQAAENAFLMVQGVGDINQVLPSYWCIYLVYSYFSLC